MSEQNVQHSINNCTYRARLLTDKGNTVFPGTVNAQSFNGAIKDAGDAKSNIYLNYSDAGLETANCCRTNVLFLYLPPQCYPKWLMIYV